MRSLKRHYPASILLLLMVGLLPGCGEDPQPETWMQQTVAIERADECHLCGMIISNFPGPKGQLYERDDPQVRKFCSTRDLFAYLLDPEHQHRIQSVFVHDMAVTPWEHPSDDAYVDARESWYVVGSGQPGAMGPTLASFAREADAKVFADTYGGHLLRFGQIELGLLSGMGM